MNQLKDSRGAAGLPAISIPAGDHSRLLALAENADDAPQVRDYLIRELDRARIVDDGTLGDQFVRVGARVTYRDDSDGRERTVRLVWPFDADAGSQRISVLSLVGAALLGLRAGQMIDWPAPLGGTRTLTVLAVHRDDPAKA